MSNLKKKNTAVKVSLVKQYNDNIKTLLERNVNNILPLENKDERIKKAFSDYNFFVQTYFSHYTKKNETENYKSPKFHIDAANAIKDGNNKHLYYACVWPRGHGKSCTVSLIVPIWLMLQGLVHNIVLVSKTYDDAVKLLMNISSELETNKYLINDFAGKDQSFITDGNWAKMKFSITNENIDCQFVCAGRRQENVRGLLYKQHRVDYVIIDDLDDLELTRSRRRVEEAWQWLTDAIFNSCGNKFRIVFVENYYAKTSTLHNFLKMPDCQINKIDAIQNGLPAWPEMYSLEHLNIIKRNVGSISFSREYMNKPVVKGTIFRNEFMNYMEMNLEKLNSDNKTCIVYCDPSFGITNTADYKAIVTLFYDGEKYWVYNTFVRQCSINEMFAYLYSQYEKFIDKGIAVNLYIEANFQQGLLLEIQTYSQLKKYDLPITLDKEQKDNKFARIESLTPYFERNQIVFNKDEENFNDQKTLIEQLLSFEKTSKVNDDGPDALYSAIDKMQKFIRTFNLDNIYIDNNDRDAMDWNDNSDVDDYIM